MILRALLVVCLAFVAWGCAPPVKTPQVLAPGFGSREISRLVLAPVYFVDEPIDRYSGIRAAEEIRWFAERVLRSKGYDVVRMEPPSTLNVARAPAGGDLSRLAPPPPPGADAVVVIRVDNFLDAGLYDRQMRSSLDIYATAALVSPGGEIVWKDAGVGRGSASPSPFGAGSLTQPSAFLAESLFATFPPRGGAGAQQGISAPRRE